MLGKRITSVMLIIYYTLVIWCLYMLYSEGIYYEGENAYMTQETSNLSELIASLVTIGGILTIFGTQIFFYRKDSQTMGEIKDNLTSGNDKLENRIDSQRGILSHEHDKLSEQQQDIRDIVRDIRLKQEQELEIQKKIQDTVPDAGMIKDGIDRICAENAELKNEVNGLKMEVVKLQEKNKELLKANRKLLNEIEHSQEWDDRGR